MSLERLPLEVRKNIAQHFTFEELSKARSVSKSVYWLFTPIWDDFIQNRRIISSVAAGVNHSLLLTKSGELWGCGSNQDGQLGLGDVQSQNTWAQLIDAPPNISTIAARGSHTVILTTDGKLWGCGRNDDGQLGLGIDIKTQKTWVQLIDAPPGISAIVTTHHHTLLLTKSGQLWGYGNDQSELLGFNPVDDDVIPDFNFIGVNLEEIKKQNVLVHLINAPPNIRSVVSDDKCALILTHIDELWIFGDDGLRNLKHVKQNQNTWMKLINTPTNIRAIAIGFSHALILTNTGQLWGCGDNLMGQLGLGSDIQYQKTWVQLINAPQDIREIIVEQFLTLAISNTHQLWGCGEYSIFQPNPYLKEKHKTWSKLSDNLSNTEKVPLDLCTVAIGSSRPQSLIATDSYQAWGSGNNDSNQLGIGDKIEIQKGWAKLNIKFPYNPHFSNLNELVRQRNKAFKLEPNPLTQNNLDEVNKISSDILEI